MILTPVGPLHFGMACLYGPPSGDQLQAFHATRSLNLGAMNTKLVACELKLWIQSFDLGAKALARNKTNHLV